MVESRWFRRAGPAVAPSARSRSSPRRRSGRRARRLGTGGVRRGAADRRRRRPGRWYRIDPVVDAGARTGQRLVLGRAGEPRHATRSTWTRSRSRPARSAARSWSAPMTARRSRLSLVDVARGCAWPLADSSDVVRTATLAPDGATLFEFRVDRRTRADLGVWRRPLDGSTPAARVLPPIAADARFGPDLAHRPSSGARTAGRWRSSRAARSRAASASSTRATATCGSWLTRRSATSSASPGIDWSRTAPAAGSPARSLSLDVVTGSTLDPRSGRRPGRAEPRRRRADRSSSTRSAPAGDHLRVVGARWPRTRRSSTATPTADGSSPGPLAPASGGRARPGWLLFGPDGRLPIDGSLRPLLRHVPDGRAVPLDEVSR